MIDTAIKIFTVAAAACAFAGAFYWLKASKVAPIQHGDLGGNEQLNTTMRQYDMIGQSAKSAALNAKGALWAGLSAIAAGVAALLSLFV